MATIHFHETTTATPEQYVAGLTDFGPGRSKLFGNSADDDLEVHSMGTTEADVTEGSGGVWEREHYDWSDPNRVVVNDRLEHLGRRLRPHLHLHAQPRRHHRHRVRRRPRGQEPQGTIPRARARKHRQGPPANGLRKQRQGDRSPAQRCPLNAADGDGRPRRPAEKATLPCCNFLRLRDGGVAETHFAVCSRPSRQPLSVVAHLLADETYRAL
jgi:hypothetical protein